LALTTTNPSALGATIGFGVTAVLSNLTIAGSGSTTSFTGVLKGIITGVSTDATNGSSSIDVKNSIKSFYSRYNFWYRKRRLLMVKDLLLHHI
jgi:hypothetical protein